MKDVGIRTLLDLSDQVLDQEGGYWIKIDAWEVPVTRDIPHGVRYSLTLHAPSGKRLLGFDNAHAVKPSGKRYSGSRRPFDHQHKHAADRGVPYTFVDAHQLLGDFFKEADRVLQEVKLK